MRRLATSARVLAVAACAVMLLSASVVLADQHAVSSGSVLLNDLGFSFQGTGPDTNSVSFTRNGLIVPTPWGDFEATIVSTPVDRMLRVPLSPNANAEQPGQVRVQPYFTAGARKNVDDDPVLDQTRAASFGETDRTNLKAGAGVLFKLDDNVELFGEYQFMRLQRELKGPLAPLGTTLDTGGFSLGISVRY